MDWVDPRLLPEAAVLSIAGYFALRCLQIFRDIVNKMSEEQKTSLHELSKAIAKNTEATSELIKSSKEHNKFMVNLNGKLENAVQRTAKENK